MIQFKLFLFLYKKSKYLILALTSAITMAFVLMMYARYFSSYMDTYIHIYRHTEILYFYNRGQYMFVPDPCTKYLFVSIFQINHYNESAENVKKALGSLPDGFLEYFTTRFPNLVWHTYCVMEAYRKYKPLDQFYPQTFSFSTVKTPQQPTSTTDLNNPSQKSSSTTHLKNRPQ